MTHNTQTFELLGPVDLDDYDDWTHIGFPGESRALCGEKCGEDLGPISGGIPGRLCPDCDRAWRAL